MEQDKCPICKSKLQYMGQVELHRTFTSTEKKTDRQWPMNIGSCLECGVMFLLN